MPYKPKPKIVLTQQRHVLTEVLDADTYDGIDATEITRDGAFGFFLVPTLAVPMSDTLLKVPDDWWPALRERRAGLVIDNSLEGPAFSKRQAADLHARLHERGVPPEAIVYVSQDRGWASDYGRWRATTGQPRAIQVLCYDYFIRKFYKELSANDPTAEARRRIHSYVSARERDRTFVSLNFKPRPYRIALLTRLIRDGLWEDGFVGFGGFVQDDLINQQVRHKRPDPRKGFLDLPIAFESAAFLPELDAKGEVLFGDLKRHDTGAVHTSSLVSDSDLDIYRRSLFTIVTETEMRPTVARITEKPLKPLANLHPLIIFGNKGALAMLREIGFLTFPDHIDEGYDEITDPNERFNAAYKAFLDLRAKRGELLASSDLDDRLLYNAEFSFIGAPKEMASRDRLFADALARAQMVIESGPALLDGLPTRRPDTAHHGATQRS
jgi:hypothetical protein